MHLFYQPQLPEVQHLAPDESKHCIKVLRKSVGDEISVIDGKGFFYSAKILEANHKKCTFEIVKTTAEEKHPTYRHLAIAPTKNMDRMEWFVEKATELGIDEISFFQSSHSERKTIKIDRLEKKVISAMKQSLKSKKPILNEMVSFRQLVSRADMEQKFIAHVDFQNPLHLKDELSANKKVLILIGPEGDFTTEEVDLSLREGFKKVSLGSSRLRTETAALVAVHLMNLEKD